MAKFVEIYFHLDGQCSVKHFVVNADEIYRVEEYRKIVELAGGIQEYSECVLLLKDGTRCILEERVKDRIIKRLLEL